MTMTIEATIPFKVVDLWSSATFVYDPAKSIDAVEVTFQGGTEWSIYIEFFMRTNDWGGDVKSIVTKHTTTITLVNARNGDQTHLLFTSAHINVFLEKCHRYIEANDIVIPQQRELEVEREIHTLYI